MRSEIPTSRFFFIYPLVPSQKYRKFSVTSRRVTFEGTRCISCAAATTRKRITFTINLEDAKKNSRREKSRRRAPFHGWLDGNLRHAVKIPGRPCIFTFPLPTSASRPYVPFIPRNDDVRVYMRRTGAAASASGNSDRDTFRGSFIHRFNGVGECGYSKTPHVDTEMASLRTIIPEIDACGMRHVPY